MHFPGATVSLASGGRRPDLKSGRSQAPRRPPPDAPAKPLFSVASERGEISSAVVAERLAVKSLAVGEKAQQLVPDTRMTNEYQQAGQMAQTHSLLGANQAVPPTSHGIGTSCGGKLEASTLLNECTFLPG